MDILEYLSYFRDQGKQEIIWSVWEGGLSDEPVL